MAYAIDPTLFESEKAYVDVHVGVDGAADRANGHTMADWRGQWEQEPNVNVCTRVDNDRFLEMYYERLSQG